VSRARWNGVKGVTDKASSCDNNSRFMKLANTWLRSATGLDGIKPQFVPLNGPAPQPNPTVQNNFTYFATSHLPHRCCIRYPDKNKQDDELSFHGGNLSALGFPIEAAHVSLFFLLIYGIAPLKLRDYGNEDYEK
jgi:hypothetical protein